jgi:photosystem II stability/assembly factor-like uncharacterized protein
MAYARFGALMISVSLCSLGWSAPVSAQNVNPAVQSSTTVGSPASAVWKPLAIGGGGYIVGINLHPNGVDRIIRTDTYGAYIWRGDAWAQLVTSTSMPVEDRQATGLGAVDAVLAPSNAKRVYLFYNNKLYRSDDKGVTFSRLVSFGTAASDANDQYRDTGYKIAVDPLNADVVYVGTRDDGLRRSTDGGATWTTIAQVPVGLHATDSSGNVTNPGAGISILFDPTSAASGGRTSGIYAGSWQNGIWRSDDAGATWRQIANGTGSPAHLARGDIAKDGTLYAADESGKVWRLDKTIWRDLSAPVSVRAVTVDPTNSARVYAFSGAGEAIRSLDGGATWTKLAYPNTLVSRRDVPWIAWTDNSFFTTSDVHFDPVKKGRIWVGQGFGVWKADVTDTATGITWQAESRGIEQLVINDIVAPPGGSPVVAAWDQGLFYKDKDKLDAFATRRGPTRRFNSAWDVDASQFRVGFMASTVSDHRFCCGWDGLNIQSGYSLNGGKSWVRFPTQPTPPGSNPADDYRFAFGSIAVSANSNRIVWMPAGDGVPATTANLGKTWTFAQFPAGNSGDSAGWQGGYFLNRKVLAADRVVSDRFYVVNSSVNSNTWGPGKNAGVWRSNDGGRTWEQVFKGWITNWSFWNAKLVTMPGRAGNLFFTPGRLDGNPDIPLMRSEDGGRTWLPVDTVSQVHAIGFGAPKTVDGPAAIYVAGSVGGQYGIWRSADNGATWQGMGFPNGSLDNVSTIDGDKQTFGLVYVGFLGSGAAYGMMP